VRKTSPAFTLIELLIAMAVLALMLVFLLQITSQTMQATKRTTQQLNSTQSARQCLDALSTDIAHAVLMGGATILTAPGAGGTSPALAFLTCGRGPDSTPSRFLAVSYKLGNNTLTRSYKAIGWADVPGTYPNLLSAAEEAATSPVFTSTLSTGILQFSVLAILEDGSRVSLLTPPANAAGAATIDGQSVPSGWTALVPSKPPLPSPLNSGTARVRGLLVAIASVDEQDFSLLATIPSFSQAAAATSDPVGAWETELAIQSLPGPARAAIRFSSKIIPFP